MNKDHMRPVSCHSYIFSATVKKNCTTVTFFLHKSKIHCMSLRFTFFTVKAPVGVGIIMNN